MHEYENVIHSSLDVLQECRSCTETCPHYSSLLTYQFKLIQTEDGNLMF